MPSVTTSPSPPLIISSAKIPNVFVDVDSAAFEERDTLNLPDAPTDPEAYTTCPSRRVEPVLFTTTCSILFAVLVTGFNSNCLTL